MPFTAYKLHFGVILLNPRQRNLIYYKLLSSSHMLTKLNAKLTENGFAEETLSFLEGF